MERLFCVLITLCFSLSAMAQTPSPIGYKTVRDAYVALSTDPSARLTRHENGWQVVSVKDGPNEGLWSFTPQTHPAFPAVVKRQIIDKDGNLFMAMDALCGASKEACDRLVQDFQKMNGEMMKEIREKRLSQ